MYCHTDQNLHNARPVDLRSMWRPRRFPLPASSAALAGFVMSVMLGVILAQTGMVALALIQPHTSYSRSNAQRSPGLPVYQNL